VLGVVLSNIGSSKEANVYLKKAYDLRDRASEAEKFYIEGHYYDIVSGDYEKAVELYQRWTQAYPRQNSPWDNLSLAYQNLGDQEKALAAATEAVRVDSKDSFAYQNQMVSYQCMNRYDEAKAVAETAKSLNVDGVVIHVSLYDIGTIQGDQQAMQRESAWASGKGDEAFYLQHAAFYQDSIGKIRLSREIAQHALEVSKRYDLAEMPATLTGTQAMRDALHGYNENARQKAAGVLRMPGDFFPRASAALALATVGDTAQTQKLIAGLSKDYPSDSAIRYTVVPSVKALNLLHNNKAAEAISELEAGRKFELGQNSAYGTFWIVYVRGLAYLQLHDGAKAAAEFQKILDHRGVNPIHGIYPLGLLGLGRAYVLQNDNAKARTAYQDFFALWKDADPDVPVLLAAKGEYAKLQ
jgi:tetratricopeptide (TPR) repeat protein